MASPLDTQDWELTATLDWSYKHNRFERCNDCRGGGVDIMYGDSCTSCDGTGQLLKRLPQQPAMPPELVEHMRKAWQEYFSAKV